MRTLLDVLLRTERYLRERGIDTPRLDAELLLAQALGISRLQIYLLYERPLTEPELETIRGLVARRGKREPMAYIEGTRAFHAIDLLVGSGVLVPRPDTETLVDLVLSAVPEGEEAVYIADIGCGPGTVGLAIAVARPNVRVYAVDVSEAALGYAHKNVAALGLDKRVAVLSGDLLAPIPAHRPIDWVVSNPPYIRSADIEGLMPEVSRFEPRVALDGGDDGLEVYRRLVPAAFARAGVGVAVEIGYDQAAQVSELFRRAGFVMIEVHKDLAGLSRVVIARKPESQKSG
jgi:release factor glutamine methyltransferase